jgi:nucleoside-diphosphate-sugar epimerase
MKKVLVIGSTGMLGKPVTNALINADFDVSLLARDVEKNKKLFPESKVIEGDVFDKKSLVNAMKGIDIVYVNLSVSQRSRKRDHQPEKEGVDNIIEAAREAGVRRLSYLSSLIKNYQGMNNFNWWAFEIKQSAVDKIKNSGLRYTIFYPSTFMETFPYQMINGHHIMMLGTSVAPMWFIAATDYGNQVVRALQLENGNKEYAVQGLEPFTFDEASKVIIKNYSKAKLKVMKAPIGVIKFMGSFIPKLDYGIRICEALNKYPEKFESENTWSELGKPTVTLAEFAKGL